MALVLLGISRAFTSISPGYPQGSHTLLGTSPSFLSYT